MFKSKMIALTKKLLIVFALSAVAFTATAKTKQYKIMGEARAGSKFKQVDAMSPIPFNKTYDQLTGAQKKIFRDSYGGLKENEKPPFPEKGMRSIYKPIIKAHKEIAREGMLYLIAMVDETGKVTNVEVFHSPASKMTQIATTVLFNTKFDPPSCGGKPCKMEFPFEFKLRPQTRLNSKA